MTNTNALRSRTTLYGGVEMRSRLEAGFAMWLDQMGWSWEYEPDCFAHKDGQWLPDFWVHATCVALDWDDTTPVRFTTDVYVEVKPNILTRPEFAALIPRILSLYESKPDAAAIVAQEGTHPALIHPDGSYSPLDWTWTGLWPIDARGVRGPWPDEWWKGLAA